VSVESLAAVLHHSRAKGTAKVVAIGIANHDGDGGAWPSIRTLAVYANVDRSTVKRAIKSLVVLGEVRVHVQAGGGRDMEDHDRPNRYEVLVECPEGCDRTTNHRPRKGWQRGKDGTYVRLDEEGDAPLWINGGGVDAPRFTDAPGAGGVDAPRTVHSTPPSNEGASTTGHGRVTGWCDGCGLTFDAHLVAIERGTFDLHNFDAYHTRRPEESTP
jgi:hypothetical protein